MKSFETDESEGNTGRWTNCEHQAFIEAIKLFGKNWKLVADHIGTRNSTQVRSHAQKHFLRETSRQAVRRQAKEYFFKVPVKESKTAKVDASTQYGEGVVFPSLIITSIDL
jgi:SHAQKYF class myb-like DNA-binding protein